MKHQTLDKALFEVIVVADGPDASTREAVQPYLNRPPFPFRYLELSQKKGPAAARNFGWLSARASLIAFTDDDCIPDKRWLKALIRAADARENIALTGKTLVPLPHVVTDHARNTKGLEYAEFITANCAVSKQALIRTGGFDERFQAAWREDSDLQFLLLAAAVPIERCPAALVVHPVREAPFALSIREQKKGMYDALLYKKHPQLYRERIQTGPLWYYYAINMLFLCAVAGSLLGNGTLALCSAIALLTLLIHFSIRRLLKTSGRLRDVAEMLFTSLIIPFLSVYWRMRGNLRYRTLLL